MLAGRRPARCARDHVRFRIGAELHLLDQFGSAPALLGGGGPVIGKPSFCFSFTSDDFDIYHLNDAMREKGWRLNGQQYPGAVHMAVTRPQTQEGVLQAWADDIPEAVAYANEHRGEPAQSSSIYGGAAAPTAEITAKINSAVTPLLDAYQSLPPES